MLPYVEKLKKTAKQPFAIFRLHPTAMGVVEDLGDDDAGICPVCQKLAETKCTGCRKLFYCGRDCQRRHWKVHKFDCKQIPYKVRASSNGDVKVGLRF